MGERLLRAASMTLLAVMLWASLEPRPRETHATLGVAALSEALPRWSVGAVPDTIHVIADTLPDPVRRAWLVALRRTGSEVTWAGGAVPALAIEVEPLGDPRGQTRVLVAAPPGSRVRLADLAGVLDTATVRGRGAMWRLPALEGTARVSVSGSTARAPVRDSILTRPILLLGAAGWESKFVLAALEERGWTVHARLRVAPGVEIRQGALGAIDTARYAAVIALDTTAASYARSFAPFARSGGGVVLAGLAAGVPGVAAIAPGRVGEWVQASAHTFVGATPRRALGHFGLAALDPGAVVIEMRDGRPAVAARRVAAGRVIQLGYEDTWRWRLAGGDDAPDAHRAWWSAIVGAAAYRPSRPFAVSDTLDVAPLAQTVAALGSPAVRSVARAAPPRPGGLRPWMIALLFAMLLLEWGSRRRRGVP